MKSNPKTGLKVNLLAPTLCSKLAISNMEEHSKESRGHIINILSVWGCEVPRREYTHFYSATKHALKAVAEGLRIELATRKLPIKVGDSEVDTLCDAPQRSPMFVLDQSRRISMSAPLEKRRQQKFLVELAIMSGLVQRKLLKLCWGPPMLLIMCRWQT